MLIYYVMRHCVYSIVAMMKCVVHRRKGFIFIMKLSTNVSEGGLKIFDSVYVVNIHACHHDYIV